MAEARMGFEVTRGILDAMAKQAIALLPTVMRDYRESGLDQRSAVLDGLHVVNEAHDELDAAQRALEEARALIRPGLGDDHEDLDLDSMMDGLYSTWLRIYRLIDAVLEKEEG
jgi:hypothetical protein